ncbi:hypothetical protein LQW54_006829 [Pestalotiopsis sp. IQ-011]
MAQDETRNPETTHCRGPAPECSVPKVECRDSSNATDSVEKQTNDEGRDILVTSEHLVRSALLTSVLKITWQDEATDPGNPRNWPLGRRAKALIAMSSCVFISVFSTSMIAPNLPAIANTTLLDDVMQEDPTTNLFQERIAELTGKEAALLVSSGTMGNQISLRTALKVPPYSILCDARGHILHMEAGGAATLWGALVEGVLPSNGHHLTLADVQKSAILREGVYDCPTRVISLENTLSGTIMPLSEMQAISSWARSRKPPIHMHLDGARLWEFVSSGAGSLKEGAELFDSITMCFTKGLGAPIGSIIIGTSAFIQQARWVRKLIGGGMRQTGVIAAPARVAVEDVFLGNKLKRAQEVAKFIADAWVRLGGKLTKPTETNMVWLDLEAAGIYPPAFAKMTHDAGLKTMKGRLENRLIVHYQISQDAVNTLVQLFYLIMDEKAF